MSHSINVLFYSKASRAAKNKLVPIYLRITVNGVRIYDNTTNKFVEPARWCSEAKRVKGNSEEARTVNKFLDALKGKVDNLETQMVKEQLAITPESFKEKWSGEADKPQMLLQIFAYHNKQMEALVEKNQCAAGTLERYETSLDHTRNFMKWRYQVEDIDIKKLDYEFVSEYEFWLKTQRSCNHNSAIKYISNFRKIVNICIRKGWLTKDPFLGFKMTKVEVDPDFLLEHELDIIWKKKFVSDRLTLVRDIYIFSCYTGLSYADTKKLSRSEIGQGVDNDLWIFTQRQKTDTTTKVPVIGIAKDILVKYEHHPDCISSDRLLPILSNQKMNAYLKEIADVCGITKRLTYHTARHTFATTVTLLNDVPIESVSKMLGHKNIKTTQRYARVIDQKLSKDMEKVKAKFNAAYGITRRKKSDIARLSEKTDNPKHPSVTGTA